MVNKVILVGNVGKDPEVRHLDNNLVVARFTLATHERWTNKDGNRTEHTEWHNIVVWNNLAGLTEKYVRKGTFLYIEGRLRSRTYDDKEGFKRFTMEIVVDTMNFLGSKEDVKELLSTAQQPAPADAPVQGPSEPPIDSVPPDDLPF
jgi:single-strand DNA-binding protein